MELEKYQNNVEKTLKRFDETRVTGKLLDTFHNILGITTEAGELADIFKKYIAYDKPVDELNLKEEIGDLMFYVTGLCISNNLNISEILEMNSIKLSNRYKNGFNTTDAVIRDIDSERKVMSEYENNKSE